MARTIPAPLLAEISAVDGFVAECLLLVARDGSRLGFTTHVDPLTIDLGVDGGPEGGGGPDSFAIGMTLSSLTQATGLDAGHAEVRGAIDDDVTLAAVLGRKWTGARAYLVQVSPGIDGFAALMAGKVRDVTPSGEEWVMEIRGHADALNQIVGRQLSPFCDADRGDFRCTAAGEEIAATVTAVTDAMRFSVGFAGTYATDFFNAGKVEWDSGELDGSAPEEIFKWTSGGAGVAAIVMFVPLVVAPQIGDTMIIKQGCPKTRAACRDIYDNVVNFTGHPDLIGTDALLRAAVPSS